MKLNIAPPTELVLCAQIAVEARMREIQEACGLDPGVTSTDLESDGLEWKLNISLKPEIALKLRKCDRLDLALEHLVLDPPWAPAFFQYLRVRARRNLTTAMRFTELEREVKLLGHAGSQVDVSQDRLIVSGGRVFWAYDSVTLPSVAADFCSRSEQLELELMSECFLPYSTEHQQHVLFCDRCRSRTPVLTGLMESLVDLDLRLFKARLQVLAATQNVSPDRVDELLSRQAEGQREDWCYAAELLGWRALVTANYLTREMQLRHLVPDGPGRDAWRMLQNGTGHPRAVKSLQNLDERLLRAGTAARLLGRIWWDDIWLPEEEFRIPTDGDISEYAWAVPVETNPHLPRWEANLAYDNQNSLRFRDLVEVTQAAASAPDENLALPAGTNTNEILENTRDMVWVNAQRLEELANKLGPSEEDVRDCLRRLLGANVLDRLAPYSRQFLIDAERIFITGSSTAHLPLILIGNAFELQIRSSIVPMCERDLSSDSLYDMENLLLGNCSGNIQQRFSKAGLDPAQVGHAISRVRKSYNTYKHREIRLNREEVREIREYWYGLTPGVLGVFQAITGCGRENSAAAAD